MKHEVERHYERKNLEEKLRAALVRLGKDLETLSVRDLSEIDQFHVRGFEATRELAETLELAPGEKVLDVGCGIGGPSRVLAADYGCVVTGVDLTVSYCETAEAMAGWVGMGEQLDYHAADALTLPFEDECFDVVWTQHVAMNIADKTGLYGELRRVLKPGGRLGLYDVLQGAGGEVIYPVPWARDPSISFLVTAEELRRHLEQAGFRIVSWRDRTEAAVAWFHKMRERVQECAGPPPGVSVLVGEDYQELLGNLYRSLEEGRAATVEVVCRSA